MWHVRQEAESLNSRSSFLSGSRIISEPLDRPSASSRESLRRFQCPV